MSSRKKTPTATETAVLTKSARRCPICYHLYGDLDVKHGQIAHLDQNPANIEEENLAFMCMPHHSEYDSTTSQHKNFTHAEVLELRSRLYNGIAAGQHHPVKFSKNSPPEAPVDEVTQLISKSASNEVPVTTLLREAKFIAIKRDDKDMLEWIDRELNGYEGVLAKDLPNYRQSYGEAYAFNPYRGWQNVLFQNTEEMKALTYAPSGQGIGVIETMLNTSKPTSIFLFNGEAAQLIQKALDYETKVQIRISATSLQTIIVAVRNKVHEWALRLS